MSEHKPQIRIAFHHAAGDEPRHRDGQIELYCDAWKINKRGERKEREIPQGWIDNLLKDFPIRLTRAALHSS